MEDYSNLPNERPDFSRGVSGPAFKPNKPGDELMEELRLAAGALDEVSPDSGKAMPHFHSGRTPGAPEPPEAKPSNFRPHHAATPLRPQTEIRMPSVPGGVSRADAEAPRPAQSTSPGTVADMGLLMDVHLPVSIELGRTELSISEILELRTGSIVELDRLAGEPVDVYVNGQALAKGEVVVLDERFGVRITALAPQREGLEGLGA